MNKTLLWLFLIDLGILSFFSACVAFSLLLLDIPFGTSFLLSFVSISLVGFIINKIVSGKNEIKIKKLDYETSKLLASQSIVMPCAYCKTQNSVFFNAATEMTFNCTACKQPNKVIFQFASARITTPLDMKISDNPLFSDSEIDKE